MATDKQVSIYQETHDRLERVHSEIEESLPKHMAVTRFIRAAALAVQGEPRLQQCSSRSIIAACLRAAHDGLMPDGREGALVAYEARQADGRRAMQAQWLPMIAGIRKKVFNAKLLAKWDVQVVQEGDQFEYELGTDPFVKHKPAPRGGRDRKVLWAYSVATFPDGSQTIEVMNQDQLADIQKKSRAQRGPWNDPVFFPEMCRKTVAKLHAKQLPTSPDIESIFRHEDEAEAQLATMADREPRVASPTSTRAALEQFVPQEDEPSDQAPSDSEQPSEQPEPPPHDEAPADAGRELPLESAPQAQQQSGKKLPTTAAEYRQYYEKTRDAAKGRAGAQMLRKWFYGGEQNELRAACGVDLKQLESDLHAHLAKLEGR